MSGSSAQAVRKGPGRYVAPMGLNFATSWAFTVSAQANGSKATRTFREKVK